MDRMLEMEEVYRFGQTARDMMDSGKKEWLTVEEDWFMLMEMSILESGRMTRLTVMEFNKITTEVATKATGSTTNNMVTELKPGQMAQHILVSMPTV